MESHWESHGLNPKIQKYAARFFTTNSPKKLKSKNQKYPKSQIPKKQSLESSQNPQKTNFGNVPRLPAGETASTFPNFCLLQGWRRTSFTEHEQAFRPNTFTEHVQVECGRTSVQTNRTSVQMVWAHSLSNRIMHSGIRTSVQITRTCSAEHVQIRTPNKTPNTNKRFPNTEHCSDPALACCTESTKLKKSNAKKNNALQAA